MSVSILSSVINLIAPHLAMIFNHSVQMSEFPDLMKYSKVIPLFKAGDSSNPSNFRPISILPTLSKVFEKIMLNQLVSYFDFNNILHSCQFGFTKNKSTTDAGIALMKHILDAWEQSCDTIGVFCDLSKAFDCVRHDILLNKLNYYGVTDEAQEFISSYLTNRVQKVSINSTTSNGSPVMMGIPQGSILGPFLFLVYMNDLPHFINNTCNIILFADDTSLLFKVKRNIIDCKHINNTLSRILKWFTTNNLLLNPKKTKCLRFSLCHSSIRNANLTLNGESLEIVDRTVFLGFTIDAKLQWGAHLASLSGRLSSAAYAVRQIRRLSNIETARLVYFSYFHSLLSYGILLWGNAADIGAIFVLQKRAIRSIYNLNSRESLRKRFREFNILTVASQYIFDNLLYIHKNKNTYLINSDIHLYNTRNRNKFVMPRYRLCKTSKSFIGLGIKMYNKLSTDISNLQFEHFKTEIKRVLIKKSYYTIEEYFKEKHPWS